MNTSIQGNEGPESPLILVERGSLTAINNTFDQNAASALIVADDVEVTLINDIFSESPGATVFMHTGAGGTLVETRYNLFYEVAASAADGPDIASGFDASGDPLFDDLYQRADAPCDRFPMLSGPASPAWNTGHPDYPDVDDDVADIGAFGGPDFTTVDLDGDGADFFIDCDDFDAARSPTFSEIPNNGIDDDCDGASAVSEDGDGDGYTADGDPADCDDTDAARSPGLPETPYDGLDNDCDDGTPDDDLDGDGWLVFAATPDCDDADATVHPGAPEVLGDGADQDCDGADLTGGLTGGCASAESPVGLGWIGALLGALVLLTRRQS
ncbi:MAG: putative metal-binding motif-containing protein [Alphaproteobacteria bacterium]|nr:putative metal-binding motif-containing protein [Alphaproteobacteria bacterium]